jgi:hypothetical protein
MALKPLELTTVLKPADKVMWSRIDDEAILLNLHNGYYYTLNAVGCDIWKLLDGTQTVQDIARALCNIYEVTQEQSETDLLALLQECLAENLITIVA